MTDLPGWFGKLPALDDFASRRLPQAFVRGWDDWLQQGLATAIETHGPGWLDAYLDAAPRRFWLAADLLGRRSWAGVLMPSVDRVGRRFALTVAAPSRGLDAALASAPWFDAIEVVARRVFDEGFEVDDFEREIGAAGAPAGTAAAAAATGAAAPPAAPPRGSLWWHGGESRPEPIGFDALPPPASFALLFAANGLR